jgi:hypothetical protein
VRKPMTEAFKSIEQGLKDDALLDRIKAHRSAPDVYDPPTFDQMAERIFELEAKLLGQKHWLRINDTIILVINIKRRLNDIRVVFIKEIKDDRPY